MLQCLASDLRRKKFTPINVVCLGIFAAILLIDEAKANSTRLPNIVLILADDLGWSDTSLYGTTDFYRTPNIRRLADRGMTFTRAYSASPLCSPTRASILTGLAPARHGITAPNCHTPTVRLQVTLKQRAAANRKCIQPDSITRLDPATTTLAESLRSFGYATGHFGKWHLGPEPFSPLEHGFDVDIPHWPGPGPAGSYVAPWAFKDFDHDPEIPDEHIEDRMAKEAVAFMRTHRNGPFFLNYWMFSVHAPFDAKKELIKKYAGRVDKKDEQRCPTYAAMIESMDDAVGTLLDELDRLKLADDTIIVFASDNGGNMYNLVEGERPTSNRPLRGGKATMYEGGVRTPAVIVWPNQVAPATTSDAIIQSMDYYPTLLELIGREPAEGQSFDGISLVPALKGGPLDRDGIFTYFPHQPRVPDWLPPAISVHSGDWKLIRLFHGGQQGMHRYKLFDLRNDIGEQADLSGQKPQRVRALDAMIQSHLQATGAVVPAANPDFDPRKYDASAEGIPAANFKRGSVKTSPTPRRRSKPVAGWQAGGTCTLSLADDCLRVTSDGRDPYLSYRLSEPIEPGDLTLTVRLRSDSKGHGQIFWNAAGQPFAAARSQRFSPTHDNQEHEQTIRFSPTEPVRAIRLDPSRGAGTIEVFEMQLRRGEKLLKKWSF